MLSLPEQFVFTPDTDTDYTLLQQKTLSWTHSGIYLVMMTSAVAALIALAANNRPWQIAAQRALFWTFLVRTAYLLFDLALPSEGGVGGFLLLLALPVFLGLTIISFCAVRAVRE